MYAYVNMTRTTAQFILCLKQRETPKASSLGKGILYTLSSYMGANDNLDNQGILYTLSRRQMRMWRQLQR